MICARNPMMYRRRNLHCDLCVLRISPEVLDIRGAVVTDRNAFSNYAAFYPSR
ncbi:MAG: DarT ssDNA thymidine ADP-ribosyltransferase family protein [Syntrophomonadaceae bacterium]